MESGALTSSFLISLFIICVNNWVRSAFVVFYDKSVELSVESGGLYLKKGNCGDLIILSGGV